MEDGAFITEKQEKMTLPDSSQEQPDIRSAGQIGLVHPIELSEDVTHAWQSQLEDYRISQPVEQLCNPVNYKTEEEKMCRTGISVRSSCIFPGRWLHKLKNILLVKRKFL